MGPHSYYGEIYLNHSESTYKWNFTSYLPGTYKSYNWPPSILQCFPSPPGHRFSSVRNTGATGDWAPLVGAPWNTSWPIDCWFQPIRPQDTPGWWLSHLPIWKNDGVRQLGWWQYMESHQNVPNHQPNTSVCDLLDSYHRNRGRGLKPPVMKCPTKQPLYMY